MVAAPRICRRRRRGYTESRYPSHGEYLWRDVADDVCEDERHHGQAPHQQRSNTLAKDHCHGEPRKCQLLSRFERASMPAVPADEVFRLTAGGSAPERIFLLSLQTAAHQRGGVCGARRASGMYHAHWVAPASGIYPDVPPCRTKAALSDVSSEPVEPRSASDRVVRMSA